jgi:hypothetical protein
MFIRNDEPWIDNVGVGPIYVHEPDVLMMSGGGADGGDADSSGNDGCGCGDSGDHGDWSWDTGPAEEQGNL